MRVIRARSGTFAVVLVGYLHVQSSLRVAALSAGL
jgi:hypothetical protein